ncbi:hypothetical protein FRC17_011320 [Serendipita sp. 399]|nr:hypothetical protein FRC17_011320 [Serendipita sp. 399]
MAIFSKLALVAASVAGVVAAPWDPSTRLSTHRTRQITRDLHVESYHPPSIYKTFSGSGFAPPVKRSLTASIADSATSFLTQELNVGADGFKIQSTAQTDIGTHVWAQRIVNGIPVANAVANVGFNTADNVVAFGANFQGGDASIASATATTPTLSKEAAVTFAEQKLNGSHNGREPTLEYYTKQDGSLALTWVVQVQTQEGDHWFEAFVDASGANGDLVAANDFVAGATYKAVDPRYQDVSQAGAYTTFEDPEDSVASPQGWHKVGSQTTTDTSGNNAIAYKGSNSGTSKQSGSGKFDYTYDTKVSATSGKNVDAARVNTFFLSNKIHDISYRYGFTEATFNFQEDNFGKGGQGGDAVRISVQDAGGENNANFATPPDGQYGQMRMYIWTRSTPNRDGDLSNDVIAHEQTHGITNRMTGGGTGRCLQTTESSGMGEGWSDAFAEWLEHKDSSVSDFVVGAWIFNNPKGIRTHPYSTSTSVNPLKYSSIGTLNEVHAIGEVWANMLHNVYAELVGQYGWAEDSYTNPDSDKGNVVFLRTFFDALLLQPCNPTVPQARDAWIKANENRYQGKHVCAIWKAFSSRGLGPKAKNFTDDFSVPATCGSSAPAPPAPTTTRTRASTTTRRTTVEPKSTEAPVATEVPAPVTTRAPAPASTSSSAPAPTSNCPWWFPNCWF